MPSLDELDEDTHDFVEEGQRRAKALFTGFLEFAFSGNILEIAVGLILANVFTALTTSFVTDVMLPPISVLLPLNRNMDEKFAVLRRGPNYEKLRGYTTLEQARFDGAVVLAYGVFINKLVNFLGVGVALYGLANIYQMVSHDPIIKHTVKCKYCKKFISEKAIRCINCTSWQDGREDRAR